MARVLTGGGVTATTSCQCGALVEFQKSDVSTDERDQQYVRCPDCYQIISGRVLTWINKEVTEGPSPSYRCNTPYCGESGVCEDCLARARRRETNSR